MSTSDDNGNWSPPPAPRSPISNDNQAEGVTYARSGRPSLLETLGGERDGQPQLASASETTSFRGGDEIAGARSRTPPPVQTQAPSARTQYSSAGDRSARSCKASTGSSNTAPTPNPNIPATSIRPPAVPEELVFSNLPSVPNVFNNPLPGSHIEPQTPQQNQPQQSHLSPTPDLIYPPNAVPGVYNHGSHPSSLPLENHHEALVSNSIVPHPRTNIRDRLNLDSISKIDALDTTVSLNGYSTNAGTDSSSGQVYGQAGTSSSNAQLTLCSPSGSHSIQADESNSNSKFSPEDTRNRDLTPVKAETLAPPASSASVSHSTSSFPGSSFIPAAPPDFDSILPSAQKLVHDIVSARAFIQTLSSRVESIESRNASLQTEVNSLHADSDRLQGQLDQSQAEKASLIEQIKVLREELQTSKAREEQEKRAMEARVTEFAEGLKQSISRQVPPFNTLGAGPRYENQLEEKLQHERAEAWSRRREAESSSMQVETSHSRRSSQTPPPVPNAIDQITQPLTLPTSPRNVQQGRNEGSADGEVQLGSLPNENSPNDTQASHRHLRESPPGSSVVKEEEELPDSFPSAVSTIPERFEPINQDKSPSLNPPLSVSLPAMPNRNALPDYSQQGQPHSVSRRPSPQSQAAGSNARAKSKETLPWMPSGALPPIVSSNDRHDTSMSIVSPTTQAPKHSSRQNDGTGTRMLEQGPERSGESATSNSISPSLAAAPIDDIGGRPASDDALAHAQNRWSRQSPTTKPVTMLRRRLDHYSPSPPPPAIIHSRHRPPSPPAVPLISDRHYSSSHSVAHHEPTQPRNHKRPREEVIDSYRNEYRSPPPRRTRLEDSDRRVYGPRTPISGRPECKTTEWMQNRTNELLGAEEELTTNVGSGSKDPHHHSQNPANFPLQHPHTLLDRMSDNGMPSTLYNQDRADTQSFSNAAKRGPYQNRGGAQGRGQGLMRGGYGKQPRGRGGKAWHATLANRMSSSRPSNNPPLYNRIS